MNANDYEDKPDEDGSCENGFPYFLHGSSVSTVKSRIKRQQPSNPATTGRQRSSRKSTGKPGVTVSSAFGNGTKRVIRPTKPTKAKSATTPSSHMIYDDEGERNDLEAYDDYSLMAGDKSPFWNVTCINRTFDENFKSFSKGVNRNISTVHVPINVYKQDIEINMRISKYLCFFLFLYNMRIKN